MWNYGGGHFACHCCEGQSGTNDAIGWASVFPFDKLRTPSPSWGIPTLRGARTSLVAGEETSDHHSVSAALGTQPRHELGKHDFGVLSLRARNYPVHRSLSLRLEREPS